MGRSELPILITGRPEARLLHGSTPEHVLEELGVPPRHRSDKFAALTRPVIVRLPAHESGVELLQHERLPKSSR
jgi:hypothetical protein